MRMAISAFPRAGTIQFSGISYTASFTLMFFFSKLEQQITHHTCRLIWVSVSVRCYIRDTPYFLSFKSRHKSAAASREF